MASSLLIEETNKIRVSVGLKPIPVPSKDEFFVHAEVKAKEPIVKAQEPIVAETLNAPTTEVPLLAESKLASTSDWLDSLGTGKESSTLTVPTISQDPVAYSDSNTINTFTGTIGHSSEELSKIESGETFTLNDQDVIDAEESAAELSHPQSAHAARIQRHEHAATQDVEASDNSKSASAFISVTASKAGPPVAPRIKAPEPNRVDVRLFDGDLSDDDASRDYTEAAPIKMKKMKKNKKSQGGRRKRELDEDIFDAPLAIASLQEDPIEDETAALEAELARARHLSQKSKRFKMLKEDQEREKAQYTRLDSQRELEGNIYASTQADGTIISDTTEFLRLVGSRAAEATDDSPRIPNTAMDDITEVTNEMQTNGQSDPNSENEMPTPDPEEEAVPKFNQGLGSALAYLRKNQSLPEKLLEQQIQHQRQRQQAAKRSELMRMQIAIEERVLREELASDKNYMNLAKLDRPDYFESRLQERIEEKGIIPIANETKNEWYDPNVHVSYRDESGQLLDTKGAFKQLSHHFHGAAKRSDKRKTPIKSGELKLGPRVL